MSNIIDRILAEACLDDRIEDGIFDIANNTHMDVLRENLVDNYGVSINDAKMVHNKVVEGKYPERQAYNKDGLLVTFPTPQHKQRAIQRGTHFEKDPSAGPQNVFGGGQQPAPEQPPASNVFGGGQPAPKAPAKAPAPQPPQPPPAGGQSSQLPASDVPAAKPIAPAQSAPSSLPASETPPQPTQQSDTQQLEVEPPPSVSVGAQSPAPPPNFDTPKPPQTRAAEAEMVKQIMHSDDTTPSLTEKTDQLKEIYKFAKRMGYRDAMRVILKEMTR